MKLTQLLQRDLPMYALVQSRIAVTWLSDISDTASERHFKELQELEHSLIVNDNPPHAISDRNGLLRHEAREFYLDTLAHYRKLYDTFNGFSAFQFKVRRIHPDGALLEQFGRDCALRVDIVNASTSNVFPGCGYLISGTIPSQVVTTIAGLD
jgi:hypothetical protein